MINLISKNILKASFVVSDQFCLYERLCMVRLGAKEVKHEMVEMVDIIKVLVGSPA